jgi:transposase
MFFPEGAVRVHLYGRPVDMRKSFNGLHALARHGVGQDPLSGICSSSSTGGPPR